MALKQSLFYKLSQKLSPQQIQLMKLIQLPTQDFEEKVNQELEENPALTDSNEEADDDFAQQQEEEHNKEEEINVEDFLADDVIPDYRTQSNNYSVDDDDSQVPYASGISFPQYLKNQLATFRLNEQERGIAEFLIGSIDGSGYIRRDLEDIVDDLAFTQNIYTDVETVESILKKVQKLDPSGVGARNLKECLLIQLERKKNTVSIVLAKRIIADYFEHFAKKHYKKIMNRFDIDENQLKEAIREVEKLNPKPGGAYASNSKIVEHVVPDFTIRIVDGELQLALNSRNAPELHVSRDYADMFQSYKDTKKKTKSQKDAVQFIKQKLEGAKWFIEAVKQRQNTLYNTMKAIMDYQHDFFLSGDEQDLKPMILKDIAEKINMDISTVSRVANSKYVDTPYGTKLIKEFFSESMKNTDGEDVSTREIKKALEEIINAESKKKPLTDAKLASLLKEKGYPIARRTVAKYREQLDFPVARLRKKI
jgi:RNA polymerase sigma-54 factor